MLADKLDSLKNIKTKRELAILLGVKPSFLTHTLYIRKPENCYSEFEIPKKKGGYRKIKAPNPQLKSLQSKLSVLLLDCMDIIKSINFPNVISHKRLSVSRNHLKIKVPGSPRKESTLSHGFERNRSILTNAVMHTNQKNILNIDLKDYFDSFNFGRVRGFFIKNRNFQLHSDIATVIAQIACFEDKLPQGSPCSPVITNLITHSLDIRLASLSKKHSCTYTRYADDISISTRKKTFPAKIAKEVNGEYVLGKKLRQEIKRSGFKINNTKTRIQYKDSRQDVTGLVVNNKPNVKKEYWRTVRSQCHSLFHTGEFTQRNSDGELEEGNINRLEGKLNFIDQVDRYNRMRQKEKINHLYALSNYGHKMSPYWSGREKTFSRFIFYRLFYSNVKPTILCEGKTDNVYLKAAINELVKDYPKLASPPTKDERYNLLVRFVEHTKRTKFLLELSGGSSYISFFIGNYKSRYGFYKAPKDNAPVILVLDNDSGFDCIEKKINKIDSVQIYPTTLKKDKLREAEFIHITENLYIVLTPISATAKKTDMESLFDDKTRLIKYDNKCFNTIDKRDEDKDLSKDSFSRHVIKNQKTSINFDGYRPLLDRLNKVIEHYDKLK
ncbi:MAG: RNA-directed DNA polymerase [Gammaproteobacteria bacterium]|nr:RNA-directed DNA polymerase [Gammaproteobacteria bacterium]